MKTTIIGIIFFLLQMSLALFYNQTLDLIYITAFAVITFTYILYKFFSKQYPEKS